MVCERFVTFVHMFSMQYVFSRYSLPLLALLVATQVHAQHGGVVVHMETGVPLRDVVVMTNTGERAKSDYRGQFQLTKPSRASPSPIPVLCPSRWSARR